MMSRRLPFLAPVLIAFHAASLSAQAGSGRSDRWTIDDLLTAETAGSYAISPNGRFVVWTKSEMDEEKGRRYSNLWITRTADGEAWAMTHGKDSFGSPQWSPDGRLLAFTSSREFPDRSPDATGSQLWLMRIAGGEPWPVTTSLRGLRQFEWKGSSSDTLVLAAQEAISQRDRVKKKLDDTGQAVEDTLDSTPVRLWALAVKSKAIRRLTDQPDPIQTMAVSPDGRRAITRNTASLSYQFDAMTPPRTFLVDLASGDRREILTRPVDHDGRPYRIVPVAMAWSHDARGIYIEYEYSSHAIYRSASIAMLGWYDVDTHGFTRVPLDWPRGLGSFAVVPGGFLAMLEDGVRLKPARFDRSAAGWTRHWIEGEHVGRFTAITVADSGNAVAYTMTTATTPPQPFFAVLNGARMGTPKQLASLNESFAKKPALRADVIHWTGARGDSVEGILYYPIDYVEGRRYPLIHSIHGGPAGADRDAWSQSWGAPVVLYLQKGAFALKTNYHGSCCYGLEWVESIGNGNYYDLEVPDLEAGVDHLIARGLVHPDSVATAGWSNGAILSTALTVHNPQRYKAAIVGAGDVEWISDWGNVDFGASFNNYYFGKSPIEDPQLYIDKSPYFRLPRVRTPTLLFTGTEDRNVPPSQSWSHFRALQQLGNTETRLVLFPGEPHGLGKLAHQRRKVDEEMRWLDLHLWGRTDTARIVIAEASPLAGLLQLGAAARVDGLYGVRAETADPDDGATIAAARDGAVNAASRAGGSGGPIASILVPETVRRDSFEVGRFEVTRAQWKAFEPAFDVAPGPANLPVSGISFERARAYAAWLAERTGRAFRLPTKTEWESLGAGSGGNTLDYWAGYAANPDDAAALASIVATVPGNSPLLREVGATMGDAIGDPPVWDLGGNVAEWVMLPDGTGEALGRSADRPADRRSRPAPAAPEYRGLRVVVGR
ncbi:MAG: prolyl oligopeptidase family serine peptidase [Gemmatimonadetes bacterium]|nr:prolyl oligopeptidase family serine peptidase [Gemmatimonadota bacterium]